MSKQALLSILALYNFDNTIFDNLVLPEGVEKDNLIDNLLMELAELEIVYANPVFLKFAIGAWSKKELPIWNKLNATTNLEYNPIWNFDRTEEYTDSETRNLTASDNETRNLAASDSETRNLTGGRIHTSETTGTTANNGKDTTTEYVAGFNSADAALSKKIENDLGSGNTVSGTVGTEEETTDAGTVTKAMTDTGTVTKAMTDTGTITNTHAARLFGNIGVTTTQQMIEAERNVVKFNITDFIINSFKMRFCILVY